MITISTELIPELATLEKLSLDLAEHGSTFSLCQIPWQGLSLPVTALCLGSRAPDAPVVFCVGGVHGLERIGSQVVLGFVETLAGAFRWDSFVSEILARVRLLFIPVVNPVGVLLKRRSNGNGVDLMRNAPVDALTRESRLKIYRGQRFSPRLPWYRGAAGTMEPETQALCEVFRRETHASPFVAVLDVHSGFIGDDRLWFPYARTRALFPHVAEMFALKTILDETYPKHRYRIEPQALHYTTHGDLWDYLYGEYSERNPAGICLPITLELGASTWLRKRRRLPSKLAFFHPLVPHRTRRVLRQHIPLFEFLLRAAYSWERWSRLSPTRHRELLSQAYAQWQLV